jgi:hypothetical protein
MMSSANDVVRAALDADELDKMLLGWPPYQYLPKWSPATDTDLPQLLHALYGLVGVYPREDLSDRLRHAIEKIVVDYEGLGPVASCILFEASARAPFDAFGKPKADTSLRLPLDEIADDLRQSVRVFSIRLEKDKTGVGSEWPDGRLGDFRRLSKNTVRYGGPSFVD